jgi:hypothetical protein
MKTGYWVIVLILILPLFGCTDSEAQKCFNFGSEYDKSKCFVDLAKSRGKPEICEMISDNMVKDRCYTRVAYAKRDISICDKVNHFYEKEYCQALIADATQDISICYKISAEYDDMWRNRCFIYLARGKQNVSICDNISVRKTNLYPDYSDSDASNIKYICRELSEKPMEP